MHSGNVFLELEKIKDKLEQLIPNCRVKIGGTDKSSIRCTCRSRINRNCSVFDKIIEK